jgi:hypothetical protein
METQNLINIFGNRMAKKDWTLSKDDILFVNKQSICKIIYGKWYYAFHTQSISSKKNYWKLIVHIATLIVKNY